MWVSHLVENWSRKEVVCVSKQQYFIYSGNSIVGLWDLCNLFLDLLAGTSKPIVR